MSNMIFYGSNNCPLLILVSKYALQAQFMTNVILAAHPCLSENAFFHGHRMNTL